MLNSCQYAHLLLLVGLEFVMLWFQHIFFGSPAMQGRGEVWSLSLESFAEDGEGFRCPDIDQEVVPPLRCQNREELKLCWAGFVCSQRWGYLSASWYRWVKCSRWGVWSVHCLEIDGSVDALKASAIVLNWMRAATGSQWRPWRRGRIWEDCKWRVLQRSGYAPTV